VNFSGDLEFGALASLAVEIGGIAPGTNFDKIVVADELVLAGSLDVSLINSFSPTAGQSFDIIDFASLSGTFTALNLPALAPGLLWNTSQLYSLGVLTISVGLLGDYNNNGTVDAADYVVWRHTLGQTGVGIAADGNGDNFINQLDYNVWAMHFGETAGSGLGATGSASAAVPEPASLVLTCCALLCAVAVAASRAARRLGSSRTCRLAGGNR
jgi:hypothetical protein